MTNWEFFASAWNWKPSVLIGCGALLVAYAVVVRLRFTRRSLPFIAGLFLLLLALVSPLDELADSYLFSAHMAKHMLLVLVIPALLLIGMPAHFMQRALSRPAIRKAESILGAPVLAWIIGIAAMAVWHIPALFNAALASEPLHIVEHLSLLIAGTIFWWPLLAPLAEERVAPVPAGVGYLFSACLACTVIGILLTFASPGTYSIPANVDARVLSLVRNGWGISPETDQQASGLLMWVPGCFIYLTAIVAMFARWYNAPDLAIAGEIA
ncbi:MAG: cytochrome c oxidase assembly protein [Bryobacteraceae bacterium]